MPVRTGVKSPKATIRAAYKLRLLAISANLAAANRKESHCMATKDDLDNLANQLNPNNDAYWESRGWDERPEDWEDNQDSKNLLPSD